MWLILSFIASVLQTFRNSFQRALLASAGTWAATWVRFAFGVPISLVVMLALMVIMHHPLYSLRFDFVIIASIGALAQVLATAALMKAMQASSFALGATLQHSSLLITALFGVVFLGDHLQSLQWFGFVAASFGMILSSWPKGQVERANLKKTIIGGLWGLLCGCFFAISANAFRRSVLIIEPIPTIFASCFTVLFVQAIQGLGVGIYLKLFEPKNFQKAISSWKESLAAGIAGAGSSIIWFLALALVPAALPRAINLLVEAPGSIIIGAVKFKEHLSKRKIFGILLIAGGVILCLFPMFSISFH